MNFLLHIFGEDHFVRDQVGLYREVYFKTWLARLQFAEILLITSW